MCGIRCAVCAIPKVQSHNENQEKLRFISFFPAAVTFAKIPQTIFKAAGGRGRHFVLCRD